VHGRSTEGQGQKKVAIEFSQKTLLKVYSYLHLYVGSYFKDLKALLKILFGVNILLRLLFYLS